MSKPAINITIDIEWIQSLMERIEHTTMSDEDASIIINELKVHDDVLYEYIDNAITEMVGRLDV